MVMNLSLSCLCAHLVDFPHATKKKMEEHNAQYFHKGSNFAAYGFPQGTKKEGSLLFFFPNNKFPFGEGLVPLHQLLPAKRVFLSFPGK